jgi:hypothetical protein
MNIIIARIIANVQYLKDVLKMEMQLFLLVFGFKILVIIIGSNIH